MDTLPVEILLVIGTDCIESYRGMLAIPRFARAITAGIRLDMMETSGVEVKFTRSLLCMYTLNKSLPSCTNILYKVWNHQKLSTYLSYGGYLSLTIQGYIDHFDINIVYCLHYVFDGSVSYHYGSMCSQKYSTNCGSRNGLNAYGINECLH